jgi:hypothetical protein
MTSTLTPTRLSKALRAAAAKLVQAAERLEDAAASGKGRPAAAERTRRAVEGAFDAIPVLDPQEASLDWGTKPLAAAHRATKAPAPATPAAPPLTRETLPATAEGVKGLSPAQVREAAALLTLPAEIGESLAATRKKVKDALVPVPPKWTPCEPSALVKYGVEALAFDLGCPAEAVLAALKKAKLIT